MARSHAQITSLPPRPDRDPVPGAITPLKEPRHNLSAPLTRFIGREREVAAVTRLLGATRLLTLTGAGGSGKTRLALTLAAAHVEAYPDGVWLVELAGLADPMLVPQAIAAALAVREISTQPLPITLAHALRPRAPLIILDNCEHLIGAVATLITTLLASCPQLRVLATSRETLHVPGEVTWHVPPLALPPITDAASAASVATSEAAQLFVDRVQLRHPDFTLTDENAGPVETICRRLDGLPLALELAAAGVAALPVGQLAARLDNALAVLTQGSRSALPRQQTLRGTLDWSYALLSADERAVFERLSVFAGGCDLEAAEAVCAGDSVAPAAVLPLLATLVDKSLVVMEEHRGEARYRLLETVRQYAMEQLLSSGVVPQTQQVHALRFLAIVDRIAPALNGPEMVTLLDRLEADRDNLRASLRWLLDRRCAEAGLRMCAHLFLYWYARNNVNEGRRWTDAFLALPAPVEQTPAYTHALALAHYSAGRLAIYQGEYANASSLLETALTHARRNDDPAYMTYASTQLGHVALYRGDFEAARTWYREALTIRQMLGDRRGIAVVTGSLGRTVLYAGALVEAQTLLEESLAIFREVVAHTDTVGVLHDLGQIAIAQGDVAGAYAHLAEGLACSQQWDIKQGVALCLEGFAVLAVAYGHHDRALRWVSAATTLRAALNYPMPPVVRERLTRMLAPAHAAFDAATRAEIEAAGAALTVPCAIEEAMALPPHGTAPAPVGLAVDRRAAKARYGGLTTRERSVVAQIASGKTNRAIASELFITDKTVELHVTNSLRKLGFHTRAELAAWAVAAGLAPAPAPAQGDSAG